jgi:hypothetical protein
VKRLASVRGSAAKSELDNSATRANAKAKGFIFMSRFFQVRRREAEERKGRLPKVTMNGRFAGDYRAREKRNGTARIDRMSMTCESQICRYKFSLKG